MLRLTDAELDRIQANNATLDGSHSPQVALSRAQLAALVAEIRAARADGGALDKVLVAAAPRPPAAHDRGSERSQPPRWPGTWVSIDTADQVEPIRSTLVVRGGPHAGRYPIRMHGTGMGFVAGLKPHEAARCRDWFVEVEYRPKLG